MAAATQGAARPAADREPNHVMRIASIWGVLTIVAVYLVYFVWGPHMPPGIMSSSAASQQFDIRVMGVMATPVVVFVLVYFAYALIVWRRPDGDDEDGPPSFGHTGIQAGWIIGTAVIVLSLFVFGTVELIKPNGAGAGEGPAPIWKPSGNPLQVQVIGQQWRFTYRYPQFGGFETTRLLLPANTQLEFHVTSLDVIHSFWAYQLAVKADANPGVDNVAYTKTSSQLGTVTVRCSELCGLWHGAMYNFGKVVPVAAFQAWAASTQASERSSGVTAALPPYATTYDPTTIDKLNQVFVKLGVGGAGGGYYPSQDPAQP